MSTAAHDVIIRSAHHDDLSAVAVPIEAHARYERADVDVTSLADRLARHLVPPIHAECVVATLDGDVVGYATISREYSTWNGAFVAHLDTLYVDEQHRGRGIGRRLIESMFERAADLGASETQWQTPAWNVDAARFYEQLGATALPKLRFRLPTPPTARRPTARAVLDAFTTGWTSHDEATIRDCLHPDATYVPSIALADAPFVGRDQVIRAINQMWKHDERAEATFGPVRESFQAATRTWTLRFPDDTERAGIDEFEFADGAIITKTAWTRSRSPRGNQPSHP